MGKVFAAINSQLEQWIGRQKIFFVSTAPLAPEGRINCSPKGLDSFRIVGPTTVAYLDLTGSGVETIAHLKENQRITIMFCAFDGPPRILRLYGKGEVIDKMNAEFGDWCDQFPHYPGIRSVIVIHLERIADSCGFGVPLYDFRQDREVLEKWAQQKGKEGIASYQADQNAVSLDGLPGLRPDP